MDLRERLRGLFRQPEIRKPIERVEQSIEAGETEINEDLASVTIKGKHIFWKNLPAIQHGDLYFSLRNNGVTSLIVIDVSFSDSPFWGMRKFSSDSPVIEPIADFAIGKDIKTALETQQKATGVMDERVIVESLREVLYFYSECTKRMHYFCHLGASVTAIIIDPGNPRWKIVNLGTNSVAGIIRKGDKFYSLYRTSAGGEVKPTVKEILPQKIKISTDGIDTKLDEPRLLIGESEGLDVRIYLKDQSKSTP